MVPSNANKPKYLDRNKYYRRGLVLGFSIAEVFLILLFLLLLTMVSYTALVGERFNSIQQERDESDQLIRRLTNINTELRRLNKERYGKLDLSREIVEITAELEEYQYQHKQLTEQNKSLNVSLTNALQKAEIAEQVLGILQEEDARLSYEDMPKQLNNLLGDLSEARKTVERTQQTVDRFKSQVFDLSKRPGVDNFCWYEDVVENGRKREKGVKIFDVRIWNDRIEVAVPRHTARHRKQYSQLPIDFSTASGFYSDQQFRTHFRALYEYGSKGLVPDQPAECHFQVWLWDNTSKRNKLGFKQKISLVESYFYKLQILNEAWPH